MGRTLALSLAADSCLQKITLALYTTECLPKYVHGQPDLSWNYSCGTWGHPHQLSPDNCALLLRMDPLVLGSGRMLELHPSPTVLHPVLNWMPRMSLTEAGESFALFPPADLHFCCAFPAISRWFLPDGLRRPRPTFRWILSLPSPAGRIKSGQTTASGMYVMIGSVKVWRVRMPRPCDINEYCVPSSHLRLWHWCRLYYM